MSSAVERSCNFSCVMTASVLVTSTVLACGGGDESRGDTVETADRRDVPEQAFSIASGQVAIEYIAHAAFRIHSPGGKRLIIDPYASRVWIGYDFPENLTTDAVLITHPHYDHDAGQYRGHPFPWGNDVEVLQEPDTTVIGDIRVEGIRGKHADPYGKEFGQINTIFVIEIGGLRIAHLGDNGPLTDENVTALGRIDVLMMPIDADYHILKEQEIQSNLASVRPRILVPMHYRIPTLEPSDESAESLGPVEPWLTEKGNVRRMEGNVAVLSAKDLPSTQEILVFGHSPLVLSPEG